MDPHAEDDLSEVERRLRGWRPDATGLDSDAMVFAAGLAAGRRGWLLGTTLCGVFAVLACGLGAWGLSERAERIALAGRVYERAPTATTLEADAVAMASEGRQPLAPDAYFSLRRQAEDDPSPWPAARLPEAPPPPPPSENEILTAGQRDGLLRP
jgi:hypothetical protein